MRPQLGVQVRRGHTHCATPPPPRSAPFPSPPAPFPDRRPALRCCPGLPSLQLNGIKEYLQSRQQQGQHQQQHATAASAATGKPVPPAPAPARPPRQVATFSGGGGGGDDEVYCGKGAGLGPASPPAAVVTPPQRASMQCTTTEGGAGCMWRQARLGPSRLAGGCRGSSGLVLPVACIAPGRGRHPRRLHAGTRAPPRLRAALPG